VLRISPSDRSATPLLFDPNMRTPFVNQWNFSIQRQILKDMVLEVAYVGNKGTHMFRMMNANQATITPEFLSSFKAAQPGPAPGPSASCSTLFGTTLPSNITTRLTNSDVATLITAVDTGVFNNVVGGRLTAAGLGQGYFRNPQFTAASRGLQLHRYQLQRFASLGEPPVLQRPAFPTNYTWGKSLDDISDDTNGAGTGLLLPKDSTNRRLDRGRSDFDIRHQFRAGVIYELPFGKGKPYLPKRSAVLCSGRLDYQHHPSTGRAAIRSASIPPDAVGSPVKMAFEVTPFHTSRGRNRR